jgi:hypothetical protein
MARKCTKEEFIQKAQKVHGNKYDYSNIIYKNAHIKIGIICPIHGEFWQRPMNHTQKANTCPSCSGRIAYNGQSFAKKAQSIHGDKYDYSKSIFKKSKEKVIIICPIHGEFKQTPDMHINQQQGCFSCNQKGVYTEKIFNRNPSLKIKPAILYLVKFYNNHEVFYKIGITIRSISIRLQPELNRSDYSIAIMAQRKLPLYEAFILEQEFISNYKEYSYVPAIKIEGYTECFTEEIYNILFG